MLSNEEPNRDGELDVAKTDFLCNGRSSLGECYTLSALLLCDNGRWGNGLGGTKLANRSPDLNADFSSVPWNCFVDED